MESETTVRRVGWPPITPEEAEAMELVDAGFAEATAEMFDRVFPHTDVPPPLAGPNA